MCLVVKMGIYTVNHATDGTNWREYNTKTNEVLTLYNSLEWRANPSLFIVPPLLYVSLIVLHSSSTLIL